ncbi:hypothetical protein LPJ66_008672 [Kickxella alabastrina]|uniref:Uncharacterized protein n=1 Tax=Kickxella alabastrina TaxID=61397 RepID=A0ACC1I969_9FUNG|nr:hypothetical protein LPJ66_008672 [Kickxella alabastrina]
MILGIGVDILSIARIQAIVGRGSKYAQRFSRRILCDQELEHYNSVEIAQMAGNTARVNFLAKRWCLKEALYKAAFPHQTLKWHDVCIQSVGPKPMASVRWDAQLAGAKTHVSLSHDHGLLVGYVVVELNRDSALV